MAPIPWASLESRELIQPPRHPNGTGDAVPVEERINFKTFLLLFIGTVCIFILGVFCWKLGTLLRSFTRSRVTGGGKGASTHHVRAWYGWIPIMEYNEHKQRWKEELGWVRELFVCRSSRSDYNWIWWDPKDERSKQRAEDEGRLRRGPLRLMRFAMNGQRAVHIPQQPLNPEMDFSQNETPIPRPNYRSPRRKSECSPLIDTLKTRSKSFDDSSYCNNPRHAPVIRRSASEGQKSATRHVRFHVSTDHPLPTRRTLYQSSLFSPEQSIDDIPTLKTLSWRYRAWGARMQCQTFGDSAGPFKGHAGRPGTAMSFAIRSMISSGSGSGSEMFQSIGGNIRGYPTAPFIRADAPQNPSSYNNLPGSSRNPHGESSSHYVSANAHYSRHSIPGLNTMPYSRLQFHSHLKKRDMPGSRCRPGEDTLRIRKRRGLRRRPPLRNCLSGPEVRLMDNLDRKLEWLSCETDPGRKSFAFLLLHNHWLNRATWVVMDPSSRITVQNKRIQGDPRVNTVAFGGKGKDTIMNNTPTPRARANTPHLDSWRVAVNQARASSGTKEIQRTVDLLEGSAEEAADNNVDPASWILRKPQQGNGMSNKQKEKFFEGPGGWSEKLDYWQKVPRLYRLRRVVFEGRANRRSVARTGKQVRKGFGKAARKAKRAGLKQYSRAKHSRAWEKPYRRYAGPRQPAANTFRSTRSVEDDLRSTPGRLMLARERDDG